MYVQVILILINLEFSRQIFEIYSKIKFHGNPSGGNQVAPWGRTDVTNLMRARPKKPRRPLSNTRDRKSEDGAIRLASIRNGTADWDVFKRLWMLLTNVATAHFKGFYTQCLSSEWLITGPCSSGWLSFSAQAPTFNLATRNGSKS